MAQRRTKKAKVTRKNNFALAKWFFKAVWFIIKLPYEIIKFFFISLHQYQEKRKQKTNIIKEEKKRTAMKAQYVPFSNILTYEGDYDKWEAQLFNSDSKIGIIIGARGKGKTALGIKLAENLYAKNKKKIYAIGFQKIDMPAWIHVIEQVDEITNNSFVLIDEGGVLFSSRESMSKPNKLLSDLILIARHKNLSILFISQNSSNLDVNILRQADCLLLKPSSLLQKDFERKKITEIYTEVKENFEKFKGHRGLTYIYSEEFRGFVDNSLPSFWSQGISKSFSEKKAE
ncbi:MAG: zonular occludens toxin domain-containing protein [archaeon]